MRRPLPMATAETRPFWEGCTTGELRYQRCTDCGTTQVIPRALCSHCQSHALQWCCSSRHGTVLSYTEVHRAPTAAFKDALPYTIALLDMAEGFRLMTNVRPADTAAITVGARVRVDFLQVDGAVLPMACVPEGDAA